MAVTTREVEPFYRSAILALRALESSGARRPSFGSEPNARWEAFRGELRDADRLDLVLRNAAATAPAAFAPRVALALPGLADDDPFGPDWPSADHALAHDLLAGASRALEDASVAAVLTRIAKTWDLVPGAVPRATTDAIEPQTRVVATGAGAILALARHFEAGRGLDLADQVLLVTSRSGERQLLGIAAALLGSAGVPRIVPPSATLATIREIGFTRANLVVASDDAEPTARETVAAIARELGV